jgi:hypothetical protein
MRTLDRIRAVAMAFMLIVLPWSPATAQSMRPRFAAAGQLAGATSSEFDGADLGFGALFIWHPAGRAVYCDRGGGEPLPVEARRRASTLGPV